MHKLDIVTPVYRPRKGWESYFFEGLAALEKYFADKDCEVRYYMVSDGSEKSYFPDALLAKLAEAAGGRFEFLSYEKNRGKGYSLRYAVARTKGDCQIYTDYDMPFGYGSIIKAYEELLRGNSIVMAVRGEDYSQALLPWRRAVSRGVRSLNRLLLGLPQEYLDTQAGLKGFDAEGRKLFLRTTVDTFVFDTEFIIMGYRKGLRIGAVPLSLREGLHFSNMGLAVILREFRHFLRILVFLRFTRREFPVPASGEAEK